MKSSPVVLIIYMTCVFLYLGQHNDARMNVALAMTAAYHGATVANHCEVLDLTKNEQGHINGAVLKDTLTGDQWTVKAKVIIIIIIMEIGSGIEKDRERGVDSEIMNTNMLIFY